MAARKPFNQVQISVLEGMGFEKPEGKNYWRKYYSGNKVSPLEIRINNMTFADLTVPSERKQGRHYGAMIFVKGVLQDSKPYGPETFDYVLMRVLTEAGRIGG